MDSTRGVIFGKIAVKKGFISKGDLKECIKRQKELTDEKGSTPSLKKILVEAGYLTESQVEEIEQVRENVSRKSQVSVSGYEFHEKLGEGATGAVYRATQLSLDRPVAIKILYPSVVKDEEYLERFFREARTVAKLKNEHIIQGIDVGEENGVYYFVMEYVDGPSLEEVLNEEGKISEDRTKEIGLQIAKALKHAEKHDLIHRDVKPDNIMMDREGTAKLCDLGLAKQLDDQESSVTQMDVAIGTPYYMSPEQARGDDLDVRTDVYGLGASLYHASTGEVPFDADGAASVMTRHVTDELTPPIEREPSLSNAFDAVIRKMMEKDPDDRYSPDELMTDFEWIRQGKDPSYAAVKRVRSRSRSRSGSGQKSSKRQRSPRNSSASTRDALKSWPAIAVLLITGVVGYLLFSGALSDDSGSTEKETKEVEHTEENDTTGSTGSSTGEDGDALVNTDQEQGQKETEYRDTFNALEKKVNQFEGNRQEVRALNDRLTGLVETVDDEQLKQKVKDLRKEFLEEQANAFYEEHIETRRSTDPSLSQQAATYNQLTNVPELYKNTSVWNRVQEQKASIKQAIRDRLGTLKEQLRRQVENSAFQKAHRTFRILDQFAAGTDVPAFLADGAGGGENDVKRLSFKVPDAERPGEKPLKDAPWPGANWNRRVPVVVNGSSVAGKLKGFPLYVDLSAMPNSFFQNVNSKEEIRVTTADGRTQVPREVVSLNSSNKSGELHVKTGSLKPGSPTIFYIYYDNAKQPGPPNQRFRAGAVWQNKFKMVQHLNEDTGSTAKDSTANASDAQINGASLDQFGKLGGAYSFDGSDDYLEQQSVNGDLRPMTISLWYYHENGTGNWDYFAGGKANQQETIFRLNNSSQDYQWNTWKGINPPDNVIRGGLIGVGSSKKRNWTHLAATVKPSGGGMQYILYENGGKRVGGNTFQTVDEWVPGSTPLYIGALNESGNPIRHFHGRLDEVRIASAARSADWVATAYINQNDPGAFLTIGSEQMKSDGEDDSSRTSINRVKTGKFSNQINRMGAEALVSNWNVVRTNFLRMKSMWERNKLRKDERHLRAFKRKFRQLYALSENGILNVSDKSGEKLIETYAGNISMEELKNEVKAYRKDVERLSVYRERFKQQLQKIISSGETVSLSPEEDGKDGKIVGLSNDVLKIKRNGQLSVRSVASFDIEWRTSMVKRGLKKQSARHDFTFGLVSYLAGRMKLARSWLEKASASGYDRADYYLDKVDQHALSSREKNALHLIESLERAKRKEIKLAMARVVNDLKTYQDTDQYRANRTTIQNAVKQLQYDPGKYLSQEKTSRPATTSVRPSKLRDSQEKPGARNTRDKPPDPSQNTAERRAVPVNAGENRTVTISFSSPLATEKELVRRWRSFGTAGYDISNERFRVYVPESYSSDVPHGILVRISPTDKGRIPNKYMDILEQRRLIGISAKNSGNTRNMYERILMAIDGAGFLKRNYSVDEKRVYISGFSGGGKMASVTCFLYSDLFKGGVYTGGVRHYQDVDVQGPKLVSGYYPNAPKQLIRRARENRYAILVGANDGLKAGVKGVYETAKREGWNVTYIEQPGLEHSTLDAHLYRKGITFLDQHLHDRARTRWTSLTGQKEDNRDAPQKWQTLQEVWLHGFNADFAQKARSRMNQLRPRVKNKLQERLNVLTNTSGSQNSDRDKKLRTFVNRWQQFSVTNKAHSELQKIARKQFSELKNKEDVSPEAIRSLRAAWSRFKIAEDINNWYEKQASKAFQTYANREKSDRLLVTLKQFQRKWSGTDAAGRARKKLENMLSNVLDRMQRGTLTKKKTRTMVQIAITFPGTRAMPRVIKYMKKHKKMGKIRKIKKHAPHTYHIPDDLPSSLR